MHTKPYSQGPAPQNIYIHASFCKVPLYCQLIQLRQVLMISFHEYTGISRNFCLILYVVFTTGKPTILLKFCIQF